jgi:hypothetical protein
MQEEVGNLKRQRAPRAAGARAGGGAGAAAGGGGAAGRVPQLLLPHTASPDGRGLRQEDF